MPDEAGAGATRVSNLAIVDCGQAECLQRTSAVPRARSRVRWPGERRPPFRGENSFRIGDTYAASLRRGASLAFSQEENSGPIDCGPPPQELQSRTGGESLARCRCRSPAAEKREEAPSPPRWSARSAQAAAGSPATASGSCTATDDRSGRHRHAAEMDQSKLGIFYHRSRPT